MFNGQHDSRLFDARAYADHQREEEFKYTPKHKWGIYGSRIEDYTRTMIEYLPENTPTILEIIDTLKPHSTVVDVCSGPQALRDINMPINGIAITLADMRSPEEIEVDRQLGISVIASKNRHERLGDIFLPETWNYFDNLVDGADLILCRPVGGYLRIIQEHGEQFELDLIEFISTKLKNRGHFFTQRFISGRSQLFDSWVDKMNSQGFHVVHKPQWPIRALYINRES